MPIATNTDYLQAILLAVVQGVAEFLPISSSGHLVVANELLVDLGWGKLPNLVEMSIVLHLGTLLTVLVVYWHKIWRLLGQDRRVLSRLFVGTLPAVVVGLPLHEVPALKACLQNVLLTGCMFPVTGCLLIWAARRIPGDVGYTQMSHRQALTIGICQAIAILPGISRSGATIVAGLAVGLKRESAAAFSFLLAIPAIAGAAILELKDLLLGGTVSSPSGPLIVGAATSFVVGLGALWVLLRWLNRGRLQPFAWWCIPLGVAVVSWQLLRS